MYIKITVVLVLYGSIAGENNVNNTSRDQNKTDSEYYSVSNQSRFYDVLSLNTREENENGTIWKSYEHTKEVQPPPRRDGYPELSAKRELRSDSYDNNKSQAHLSFVPSSKINESSQSNFSDPMEADGTYHIQNYMHPPIAQNEYYTQSPAARIILQQMEYGRQRFRVNPCIPSYQHPQQNRYRRSETAESDPYEAQGTYNIQGYMQPYQQGNQYPAQQYFQHHRQGVMNYNNHLAVNPCMPQPPPSPRRENHIYPYPNPPKHGHSVDSRRDQILSQRIINYAPLPNENYMYPRPPNDNYHIKGINRFTTRIPITTRSRNNKGRVSWSTWSTWTTPSIRTTPTPRLTTPSIRTPSHCKTPSTTKWTPPIRTRTPPTRTPGSRTKSYYTPPIRTRTPPIRTRTPPIRTPTPPIRTRTPPIRTPTPPIRTPTPPIRTPTPPIRTRTPPTRTPGSRTKSYYTPENGRRKNGTPPWKRHTTVRPRPGTPPARRTKGYYW